MADKKYLDEDGLAVVATKVNEKLKVVTTMPATPTNGQVVLYIGTTTATYIQGGIYLYNGTAWTLISTADVDLTPYKKIFTGTKVEWEALTLLEKKEYDEADLTDDTAGGELVVSDAVTAGDFNPVTSNAVAKALEFEDLTSQITMTDGTDGNPLFTSGSGRDPWDIFSCVRYGKMVVFSVCYGTFSGKLTSGMACFSGLPRAIAPTECAGSFDTRWFIDINQTVIKCYFSRPSTELEATATRFQLVYFTE